MKKAAIFILAVCMIISAAYAEDASPYPFGIPSDASSDDVADILSPIFGEIITVPGFEEKTWAISPENKYLYDFLIEDIQLYKKENAWDLEFRLSEKNPNLFPDHLAALYAVIREQFGLPSETLPEIYAYDISGNQALRILYEEPGAIEEYMTDSKDYVYYYCGWDVCSLSAYISHYVISFETHTSYTVSLSWHKENTDAAREETAP